ncbi:MAG: hypothetical protein A3C06_03870 [Candidatus Taylorbacteria bacterium RIFCSPHIGHO2_02_FULL_46_13]|uniref:DUF3137 domain-containing protein n=1 Tax=Candidatus Taylorbacteria bacterium RIFCSPHIGHO2_02_FULL_46_13 TaxID=1802312 RepID=A0A1G2MQF4_9BACT|nr:MAG: hypothetical protein A3C06_03870 [Candidatus Taylorbacteria bacterium RIFCSPHIGHO2_02_FULL_46_13]
MGIPIAVSAVAGYATYFAMHPAGYRKLYKEKVISALTKRTRYGWMPDMSYYGQLFIQKAQKEPIRALFDSSGLYNSRITTFHVDEVFVPNDLPSHMAEINVVRGSGKHRQTVFKGLVFDLDVSKSFLGETYIRAENEGSLGIPMGSTGTRLLFSSMLKTAKLEWNDFEKLLEVQTSDETEAREILDPRFMEVLYVWWKVHKKPVRVSFKGHYLYLAIPFGKNMFEPNPFLSVDSHKKEIWEYLDAFLLAEGLFVYVQHKYRLDMQKGMDASSEKGNSVT